MGIIGESQHGDTARALEKIILAAMKDPRYGDCRSCVSGFVAEQVYPLYKGHVLDSYGCAEMNKDIEQRYEPKKTRK